MILSPSRPLSDISRLVDKRVGKAAASVLGTTGDIVHETPKLATGVLDLAPVQGLALSAKTLLNIWDTLQLVDVRCIISTCPRGQSLIL